MRDDTNDATVESWDDFIGIVNMLFPHPSYIFRGQSDSEWGLEPSISRYLPKGANEVLALALEKQARIEFESESHTFLPPNTFVAMKDMDIVSRWMIMQHHGAPTRLLDWTQSIYVAAYFAVVENLDKEGVIWFLHSGGLHQTMKEKFGDIPRLDNKDEVNSEFLKLNTNPVIYHLCDNKHQTPRMAMQRSCFTGCLAILGNHEEILNTTVESEDDIVFFRRIKIPAELKLDFIMRLHSIHISAKSLFPGIDALGRSVKESLLMLNFTDT